MKVFFTASIVFFLAVSPLLAQEGEEHKTPQQIQQELNEDEVLFDQAKKMFNPWYTGPLVTPSASMMPPGYGNIQPYLVFTDNFAAYDSHRKSHDLPHSLFNLNEFNILQFGISDTMDSIMTIGGAGQWQDGHQGGSFSDIMVGFGWLMCKQTLNFPTFKFIIQETLPTGRYQNLNSNGLALSGLGGGSWQTNFCLAIGKLFFWSSKHPLNTRLAFTYNVAVPMRVKGFNAYGGGYGTYAVVHPGNTFKADLGLELSLNLPWVLALDIAYTAQNATTFYGKPGVTKSGAPASMYKAYNDNLSLAPALEYNWNENLGVVAGIQFCVYGRNSYNFVAGQFSVEWTFGPF